MKRNTAIEDRLRRIERARAAIEVNRLVASTDPQTHTEARQLTRELEHEIAELEQEIVDLETRNR